MGGDETSHQEGKKGTSKSAQRNGSPSPSPSLPNDDARSKDLGARVTTNSASRPPSPSPSLPNNDARSKDFGARVLDAARRRPAVVTWRRLPFSFVSLVSSLSKTRAGERGEERRRFRLTLTLSQSQLTLTLTRTRTLKRTLKLTRTLALKHALELNPLKPLNPFETLTPLMTQVEHRADPRRLRQRRRRRPLGGADDPDRSRARSA